MLEKFLTVSEGEFKKLLRSTPVVEEDSDTRREAYRYAMVSDSLVICNCLFYSYLCRALMVHNHRSPTGSSCAPNLIVLTLDFPELVSLTSRRVLLCLYGWIFSITR